MNVHLYIRRSCYNPAGCCCLAPSATAICVCVYIYIYIPLNWSYGHTTEEVCGRHKFAAEKKKVRDLSQALRPTLIAQFCLSTVVSSSLSFVHIVFFLAVSLFLCISLLFQLLLSCGSFTLFLTLFLIHFLPLFTRHPVYISSSWGFYFRLVLLSDLTVLLSISLCSHRIAFLYLLFTS